MVRQLAHHMNLAEDSPFAPHMLYLRDQPEDQLPSFWSRAGQNLFLRILGVTREQNAKAQHDLVKDLGVKIGPKFSPPISDDS